MSSGIWNDCIIIPWLKIYQIKMLGLEDDLIFVLGMVVSTCLEIMGRSDFRNQSTKKYDRIVIFQNVSRLCHSSTWSTICVEVFYLNLDGICKPRSWRIGNWKYMRKMVIMDYVIDQWFPMFVVGDHWGNNFKPMFRL